MFEGELSDESRRWLLAALTADDGMIDVNHMSGLLTAGNGSAEDALTGLRSAALMEVGTDGKARLTPEGRELAETLYRSDILEG